MYHFSYRNQALALFLTAGLTASAGVFSPQGTSNGKADFPHMPKAESTYIPKAVDKYGNMTPDLTQNAEYYMTTNTLGALITPSGEQWFYTLDLDGTRLNPGNPYFVDMDFTGFHIKVYDADMQFVGQAKGDIIRPEGTLKCRSIEVSMNLTRTFFNLSSNDYEVMVSFTFNPGPDDKGNPRYGAKETTQVYSLTKEIPAGGSELLFQAPGYYTAAINTGSATAENYTIAFVEDSSWDGEQVDRTDFVIYKKAGYGTGAQEVKRFTVHKLYTMSDGFNDGMPFNMTKKGNDLYVTISRFEKTFLVDPTASEPVQTPDNNYLITLYKAKGDSYEEVSTTKVPIDTPSEGYQFRSYALGNFLGAEDITFAYGNGDQPCYILTVVDSSNDESIGTYRVVDSEGNIIKTFGENSDSYVQFDADGNIGLQFGFYMTAADGNYGIVLQNFPSMETVGFVPILFEYEGNAWSLISIPARTQTANGIFYAASALPTGNTGDGGDHYVAWFRQDGTLDHVDSMFLGENVAKVLTYVHQSALNPYLFNTDKNMEYLAWIYRYVDGSRTSLELGIVNEKGKLLASRVLPDGHTYPNAYISNNATKPTIVISYRDNASDGNIGNYTNEFISLPLNDFEGEGTVESPYLIKTFGDLNRIRFNLASHFRITNSIECATQTFYPIEGEFTGSIDGGNYDIRNLTISATANNAGMFVNFGHKAGYGETGVTARMSNINFVNTALVLESQPLGGKTVGIIASSMNNAELYNVNVINPAMTTDASSVTFGTIAGYADNVDYRHSFIRNADINIPASATLGGAFGELRTARISKIAVNGNFNGRNNVGGLVGKNTYGTVEVSDIHVNADIKGNVNVGGIAGSWIRERINRAFVEGTISANDYLGGIAGSIGIYDDSRKDIEGEGYAIIDNCLVGFSSMTAPAAAECAHRLFGYSSIDLGDTMMWVPTDPTDPESGGEYVEVPAAEESKIGKNYIITEIDAFGSTDAVSEGIFNDYDYTDSEWLEGLGYAVADWASLASEATPWVYGNLTWMPELYFEETASATLHIVDADLSGKSGETIIATLIAENVEFENLQFESTNPTIAELADLTLGNDGQVNMHIELKAVGQTDITLSYGPVHRAVVHVTTLSNDPVLNFRNTSVQGYKDNSVELVIDFENTKAEEITATSSDETIAAVNNVAAGKQTNSAIITVDLKNTGSAEITATAGSTVAKALVTVLAITGIDDVKVGVITYTGNEVFAEGCAIEIYDLQGRRMASGAESVSTADLTNGIYIVRATYADGTTATMKINR